MHHCGCWAGCQRICRQQALWWSLFLRLTIGPVGQVAVLVALQQKPFQGAVTPEVLQMRLRIYVHFLRRTRAQELRTIAATQALTDGDAAALVDAAHAVCRQFEWA